MLIDCHVHLNTYEENRQRTVNDALAELYAAMDANGVDHAVVLTSYKVNAQRPHVDEVIRAVNGDPRITIIEGLRWRDPEERTDLFNMEERIRSGLVKGIKLYPGYDRFAINDPSLESVFRIAAKHEVPVMIHCGDTYSKHAKVRQAHPLLVDDVAVDFPDVQFVICHLGNPWFQDAAEVLYKNDNVLADISGLTLGDFHYEFERYMVQRVRDMISYMGDPGKQLMYGTDWPLAGMRTYRKFFDGLELADEAKEGIAWRNAARLFKIDLDAAAAT
ncbi:amidohydrolase family protein [Thioalkalivibrio sp. XN8]|uniref:amidohydrolase family protein n=1 Tax=Thioalkalivibrio sp. XN8 TaxID=2712863 RepID=UPI0013EA231A|nr:amidohydrolase family protein [Thioalkalivibrio sp. XN8]NGP53174.1 amidohydrolase family protein [Thioalkalivibrio sp. XN8]